MLQTKGATCSFALRHLRAVPADYVRVAQKVERKKKKGRERDINLLQTAANFVRRFSPELVLSENVMIAVGVDVPRLGLIVVSGQPKGTSEYCPHRSDRWGSKISSMAVVA